ncbi:CopD family protein [Haloarchaeobius sp. TZWWS8]|uniref:CopD family protein n=1 Tax=Haloarchaeobius sp. TZWWS8 TaxID=3446121 RepID=UPI003EB83D3B
MAALLDVVMRVVHSATAATWAGTVLFLTVGILPSALDGSFDAGPMTAVVSRFKWLSRASSALLFVTGGHLAGSAYTVESLTGSPRGHLVLTMLGLWFVLTGLCEVAASKLDAGFEQKKVRTPAHDAKPFLYAASLVAVGLLVDAVLITNGAGIVY